MRRLQRLAAQMSRLALRVLLSGDHGLTAVAAHRVSHEWREYIAEYSDYIVAVVCGVAAALIVIRVDDGLVTIAVVSALTSALAYIMWNRRQRIQREKHERDEGVAKRNTQSPGT